MPRIRASEREPLRADKTESIQRPQYHTSQGICTTTADSFVPLKQGQAYTL